MKKVLSFILIFFLLVFKVNALEFDISSEKAILYNLDSGEVLYEKNANQKSSVASLTKIMTAIVAIENIDDLDKQIILTKDDFKGLVEANAVTAGFTYGEAVTYRDLLYGLLLPSGADAAKALARTTLGSESDFIDKMNEKVKELNLKSTHFSTVIGLDDENNYSTAKDMAIIFKEALKSKDFQAVIKSRNYTSSDGKHKFHSTIQSNAKKYNIDVPYILGGKTGTTNDAGLCLASIASSNGVNYMLVTLNATYDKRAPHNIIDAKTIYDYFIQNYGNHLVVSKKESFKEIKVKYSNEEELSLYPTQNITLYLNNNYDKDDIKYVYKGKEEVTPFDKKGDTLGSLKIYYQDKLLSTQKIILNKSVKFSLMAFAQEYFVVILISLVLLIIFIKKIVSS